MTFDLKASVYIAAAREAPKNKAFAIVQSNLVADALRESGLQVEPAPPLGHLIFGQRGPA